jgi:hypothetical protein
MDSDFVIDLLLPRFQEQVDAMRDAAFMAAGRLNKREGAPHAVAECAVVLLQRNHKSVCAGSFMAKERNKIEGANLSTKITVDSKSADRDCRLL